MVKNIRLLYIHNFLVDCRFFGPFMPIYFAQIAGSYTLAMAVLSAATITSAIMDVPTGILSDKIGRRFTLTLASVCATTGIALWGFSTSYIGLFLGGIFFGLSECLFNGNNNALLYETLKSSGEEGQFHHYLGRTSSMFQLALSLSAFAASFLVGHGLRLVFMLGIVPQALGVIVSLFFEEPKVHTPPAHKNFAFLKDACIKIYHNPSLLRLVIAQAISHGADESKFQFQTAFFNTLWPTWAIGIYRGLNHCISFFAFWVAGRIVDRFGEMRVLIARDMYWFVSQTIGLLLSNVATPLIFMSGSAFFGPGVVARDHLLQKQFTDEQRATMGSVASFTGSLVFALVAFCIGWISDHVGLAAGVGFGVVASVTSLPLYLSLFRADVKTAAARK